jgi:rhomboid domain-containing protein 1
MLKSVYYVVFLMNQRYNYLDKMRNNRQTRSNVGVFLLISELLRNDQLPPVTLGLIVLQTLIYLGFILPNLSLDTVCVSAYSVYYSKQWIRLLLSQFFHADDFHLYYNMTSFALKGRSLERRYGSFYFFLLVALFSISCSSMLIALEMIASYVFNDAHHLHTCAVGFSSVIFALKVLTTHNLPQGVNYLFDTIPVPSKYFYLAELIVISVMVPNASFAGIYS